MRPIPSLFGIVGAASMIGLSGFALAQAPSLGTSVFGVPSLPAAPAATAQAAPAAPAPAAVAVPAAAQDAAAAAAGAQPPETMAKPKRKPKPKPKPRKPAAVGKPGVGQVLVTNNRASGLTQLTLTSRSAPDKSAVIAKGLAPGKKVIGKIPPKAGCEFSVAGEFEDGTTLDLANVEVCKDRTLNLVD